MKHRRRLALIAAVAAVIGEAGAAPTASAAVNHTLSTAMFGSTRSEGVEK